MSVYTVTEEGAGIDNQVRYDHDLQDHIKHLNYLPNTHGGEVEVDLSRLLDLIERQFKEEAVSFTWRNK